MKLLILGGTVFLGRATVDAALAGGHEVTLFNRGQTNPDLYPEVEKLVGDRNVDLSPLKGRKWDAVIDTSGYFPRSVRMSAEALANSVGHYTFISSISVYANTHKIGTVEEDAVGTIEDETVEEITGETYGPLKALCEQTAEEIMPGRVLNIRPGLIVGRYDPTDRFTYWPVRVAKGGEVLAADHPGFKSQVIDARDLAEWNIRMAEAGKAGVYNGTGPEQPFTLGELLEVSKQVSGSDATFTWIPEEFLLEKEVGPWMELPMWIPSTMEEIGQGLMQVSVAKAVADGLTFRSLADIVDDTLDFAASRPEDYEWRAGMKPERESEILKAWKEKERLSQS